MFLRRLSKGLAPDHLNLCLNSIEGPTSHHSNSFLLSSQRNLRAVLACVPLLSASVPSQTHLSRSERTFSARRGAVPLWRKSGTGRGWLPRCTLGIVGKAPRGAAAGRRSFYATSKGKVRGWERQEEEAGLPSSGIPRRSSRHRRGRAERRKTLTTQREAMLLGAPRPAGSAPLPVSSFLRAVLWTRRGAETGSLVPWAELLCSNALSVALYQKKHSSPPHVTRCPGETASVAAALAKSCGSLEARPAAPVPAVAGLRGGREKELSGVKWTKKCPGRGCCAEAAWPFGLASAGSDGGLRVRTVPHRPLLKRRPFLPDGSGPFYGLCFRWEDDSKVGPASNSRLRRPAPPFSAPCQRVYC